MTVTLSLTAGSVALAVVWLILFLLSLIAVLELVSLRYIVRMFPEGRRAWLATAQYASLAAFAALCHYTPF